MISVTLYCYRFGLQVAPEPPQMHRRVIILAVMLGVVNLVLWCVALTYMLVRNEIVESAIQRDQAQHSATEKQVGNMVYVMK